MDEDTLKKLVNKSGFPLQIGLENEFNKVSNETGWRVFSIEHAWKNEDTGSSGFIDLVIENQAKYSKIVIECKRVQDTNWIFLIPENSTNKENGAKQWLSASNWQGKSGADYFDWFDGAILPLSYESQYCVVQGQDNDRPLLERLASILVETTEAFAKENYLYPRRNFDMTPGFLCLYLNMIVTTADLKVCRYNPDNISLVNGKLDQMGFETVPFIRFRKQLSNKKIELNEKATPILGNPFLHNAYIEAKKNTVFVVHSTELISFLNSYQFDESRFIQKLQAKSSK